MTELTAATEGGLFRITRDGPRPELADAAVAAVAADGATWWAAVDGAVWRRVPGRDWAPVAGVDQPTCLLPTAAGLLVGTAGAHLARLVGDTVEPVTSFEEIEQRRDWYTPWGGPADTRSLAQDEDGTWYVNVHVGGILRSRDSGASWRPTIDIDTDVHQVVVDPAAGTVYAATGASALAVSHDQGETWSFHSDGLHGTYLRAVTLAGDTLLVSASTGPGKDARAAVYRWRPGSATPFERCVRGLPDWFTGNIDTGCLHAHGDTVAFGTADGQVYLSGDGGATWSLAADGLPPVRQVLLR
ncbi:hypothetical protein C3Y87_04525 [Carbonactinospora thermoautotrophica]|nr:hypothetical protein [Carbonactinospora thermoautotrophica]MCX9190688.1 hypothetical protein [Carbonactinospora thermoautotrophica]